MSVDLSPDGRTLVFDSRGVLFTIPVDGGHATQLTKGPSVDARPLWSPDGQRVAFVRSDGRRQSVWVVDRQARGMEAITSDTSSRRIVSLSWSANGGAMAIAFGTSAPGFDIIDVETRQSSSFSVEPMGHTSNRAVHALAFARDGRTVIIQGGDARAEGQQLYRFSLVLRDQRPITNERRGALSPVFTGDGTRLAFLTGAAAGGLAIAIRDIAAARQRVVTVIPPARPPSPDSLVELPHYALAPDGRTAFVADGGSLWRVSLSNGHRQIIPVDLGKP